MLSGMRSNKIKITSNKGAKRAGLLGFYGNLEGYFFRKW